MSFLYRFIAAAALAVLLVPAAGAQAFPERGRPITLLVPFPPGGSADFMGRLLAEKMGPILSTQIVVANKPGADSMVGIHSLATSKNDGYTLGLVTNDMVLLQLVRDSLPYDSKNDITPVGLVGSVPFVLVTNPASKINSFKELLEASKRPGSNFNYGSCCNFVTLGVERIKAESGLRGTPIPYKGSAPAITGILSGETHYVLETPVTTEQHIKAGKLTPLAVTTPKRLKSLPDVPTLGELGMPKDMEISAWYGMVVPGGTPRAIVDRFSDALKQVLEMPDTQQKIEARNIQVGYSSPADMAKALDEEYRVLHGVIQKSGITFGK